MINEVLTIATVLARVIYEDARYVFEAVEVLGFVEIPGWCWAISHFRPLVTHTQEQDVAIFAPLLDQSHREVA